MKPKHPLSRRQPQYAGGLPGLTKYELNLLKVISLLSLGLENIADVCNMYTVLRTGKFGSWVVMSFFAIFCHGN